MKQSNLELHQAYDETIEGWSTALDLRDKETEGHSQRVTHLTVTLAKKLGIKGEDLVNIRRGALLHDIGKMGVPDNILLKPDRLSESEWEIMRKHRCMLISFFPPLTIYVQPWISPMGIMKSGTAAATRRAFPVQIFPWQHGFLLLWMCSMH